MDSIKFIGGASLQKELQGFAGFIAYQECFRKGNSSTKGTIEKSMGEQFFGNPEDHDSIGLGEQLIDGNGIFSGLYTQENIRNVTANRDNAASQQSSMNQCRDPVVLVLKPSLHCFSHDKRVIVGGGQSSLGITLSLIFANGLKNRTRHSNRTLLCRAQEHVKNGKKALSIVMHAESPYRDHVSTGNLPSGMTLDDYYLFVCQGMYELMHPGTAVPSTERLPTEQNNRSTEYNLGMADELNGDNINDVYSATLSTSSAPTTSESVSTVVAMPDSWIFTGFIIFALLGPIVPSVMFPYRSELLMTAPPDNCLGISRKEATSNASGITSTTASSATGRTATRKTAALESAAARQRKHGISEVSLGEDQGTKRVLLTLNQKISLAGIAQSKVMIEHREQSQISDRIIAMNKKRVAGQKLLINEHKFLISHLPPDDPQRQLYMQELRIMNQDLAVAINSLITSEQDIIDQAMFDLESRKTKAAEFVDLTIAAALDNSSSVASGEELLSTTIPCRTPIAASRTKNDDGSGSVLLDGSNESRCTTPASSVFIPLALSSKRAFSSLSPMQETVESTRTDVRLHDCGSPANRTTT